MPKLNTCPSTLLSWLYQQIKIFSCQALNEDLDPLHQQAKFSASEFGDCCSFNLLVTPRAGASLSQGTSGKQKVGTRAEQC